MHMNQKDPDEKVHHHSGSIFFGTQKNKNKNEKNLVSTLCKLPVTRVSFWFSEGVITTCQEVCHEFRLYLGKFIFIFYFVCLVRFESEFNIRRL